MGFLDDLGRRVTDAGQKTMQKTKELSDIARINSLITQEENKINNTYYQIGKLYVSIHGSNCEDEFTGMISTVAELEQKVQEYRKQIQDIKGIQHCEKCGADVSRGAAFCSLCGAPMPKIQAQESLEDYVKCQSCGMLVKKEMRFCTSCGKPMVQTEVPKAALPDEFEGMTSVDVKQEKICPGCGVKVTDDSLFCAECGTRL